MPGIEMDSPLAAGFGAAAGLIGGYSQGKDQAEKKRRQDELDRQNAIATAVAQKHVAYEESREAGADTRSEKELGLNQAANARANAASASDLITAKQNRDIAKANQAFALVMQKYTIQKAVLDAQFQRGQIDGQRYAIQSAAANADLDRTHASIARQFSVPEEQMMLAKGLTDIAATQAGTAATQQSTAFGAQDHSLNRALGEANLVGKNLDNVGAARGLMTPAANPALNVDPAKDPHAKTVAADTSAIFKTYDGRETKFLASDPGQDENTIKLANGGYANKDDVDPQTGKLLKDKKYLLAPPGADDFESYTSALEGLMQDVQANPKSLKQKLSQIDGDPDMSANQKAYAKRRLSEAAKVPKPAAPATGGAAGAGSPFGSSQIVSSAATEFGVPHEILDAIWQQESGRGTGLTADGVSPTKGNAGHGWFQLDPASGAPPDVLARAAKDPVYASRVAANQLAQLYKEFGSWPAAIESYNAGHPGTAKGQAYAAEVLARIQQ